MNNLLRLEQGEARLVADDPWVLVRDDVPAGGALILPLASYARSEEHTSELQSQ